MDTEKDYVEVLAERLTARRDLLERKNLPKLKEGFGLLYTSFQAFYNLLLRKSLIKEDQYRYDDKISEVTVPDNSPFMESEKQHQMSVRLAAFDSQLDFLNHYYQFSLEFLDLRRMKALVGLVNYIKWDSLSTGAAQTMTRTVAEMAQRIKMGSDQMSSGFITDSIGQLGRFTSELRENLKEITKYLRENYKYEFRVKVFNTLDLDSRQVMTDKDETARSMKRHIVQAMPGHPFVADLIKEVFEEEYSPQGERLKQEVLEALKVKSTTSVKKTKQVDSKTYLLDSFRALGNAAPALQDGLRKITEGVNLLDQKRLSFSEKFRRWITNVFSSDRDKHIFEVEVNDPVTGAIRRQTINLESFTEQLSKKIRLLSAAGNRTSTTFKRLEATDEDKVFDFLNTNIEEVQRYARLFPAIDSYLKEEIAKELRPKYRSLQIEVNAIKNAVVKANQKRHEYSSRREELEQLKRLGIATDE